MIAESAYAGFANAKRNVMAFDYGIVWQAMKTVSLSDQVSYSNVHQPGTSEFTSGTVVTVPTTPAGDETIKYNGTTQRRGVGPRARSVRRATFVSCTSAPFTGSKAVGTPEYGYFAQKFVINNATVTWDAAARATLSLTYRYRTHVIGEGASISAAVPGTCPNSSDGQAYCGTVTINENGGIFNVALRPTNNWDVNGTIEMLYDDNVFTPVSPRQTQHYRVHTLYRPKVWATISGAYNDLERHNNTNNTGTVVTGVGPLGHVDHSRVVSVGANLMPNEHYGFDFNYAYSDVYTATNSCYEGVATNMPGSTNAPAPAPTSTSITSCPGESGEYGPVKDFEDAPTQYVSAALALSPVNKLHSNIGYRISSVSGTRLFTDARDVNGSLVSGYQTPFVNAAWTIHKGFVWKGEYDYFGYGEGGRSGAQWCNTSTTIGTTPVLCSSVPNTAMYASSPVYGFTAPRNFHANNLTLGVHYEF